MDLHYFAFLKYIFRPRRRVYLDHNATTPVSAPVRRAMTRALAASYGNPSSFYGLARQSATLIEQARERVAQAIGARPAEVIFTSCATESNNAVLRSIHAQAGALNRRKIVSTPIEHPSILNMLARLETQGMVIEYCPVDREGRLRLDELERLVDGDTALVCCMLANNETGVLQDLPAVVALAQRHGARVLADCVQALGKVPIDVRAWGVDYATFSAHKLYGPKGIGALYVKDGAPFTPALLGGHQENGLRAGTESVHNIVGLGAACAGVPKLLAQAGRVRALKRALIQQLRALKPDLVLNSTADDAHGLPNTLSVTFPGVLNSELMGVLDYRGIAVSAGSACSTGDAAPSHVLTALGLSDQAARETLRISLGTTTTAADIAYTVRVIREQLEGRNPFVNMLAPAQLNETVLFDPHTFVLDVRPDNDRQKQPGLPNAHEVNPLFIERYLQQLPRDKQIIVYCPGGGLSVMISYYLKEKGFRHITNLRGGLDGWIKRRGDLYAKYAGQGRTVLKPDRAVG